MNYYELLNLSRWASPDQIRRAYTEYLTRVAPDQPPADPAQAAQLAAVREAYETLSDPVRREQYHARLDAGEVPSPPAAAPDAAPAAMENPAPDPPAEPEAAYVRQLEAELAQYRARQSAPARAAAPARASDPTPKVLLGAFLLVAAGLAVLGYQRRSRPETAPTPAPLAARAYANADQLLDSVRADLAAGRSAQAAMEVDLFLKNPRPPFPLIGAPLAELIYLRAASKAAIGNDSGAVNDYSRAIAIDPLGQGKSYANRAQVHRRLKEPEAALVDFTDALRLDPHDVLAYRGRAALYYEQADYRAAAADYTTLCELQPGVPIYRTWVGNCYFRSNVRASACAAWRMAAEQGNPAATDSLRRHCR